MLLKKSIYLFFAGLYFSFQTQAQNKPLKVVVYFNTECPICQKITYSLKQIETEFANQSVSFSVYFTDKHITKKDIKAFRNTYSFYWDARIDKNLKATKKYNVMVTPEVVLTDANDVVLYQGAVDNWFYEWGKNRLEPTEFYLKDAIIQSLNNKKVSIKKTDPIGCWIER